VAEDLARDGGSTYAPTGGESGAEVFGKVEKVWGGYVVVVLIDFSCFMIFEILGSDRVIYFICVPYVDFFCFPPPQEQEEGKAGQISGESGYRISVNFVLESP